MTGIFALIDDQGTVQNRIVCRVDAQGDVVDYHPPQGWILVPDDGGLLEIGGVFP